MSQQCVRKGGIHLNLQKGRHHLKKMWWNLCSEKTQLVHNIYLCWKMMFILLLWQFKLQPMILKFLYQNINAKNFSINVSQSFLKQFRLSLLSLPIKLKLNVIVFNHISEQSITINLIKVITEDFVQYYIWWPVKFWWLVIWWCREKTKKELCQNI